MGILALNFGGPQGPEELVPFLTALFHDVLPVPGWVKGLTIPLIARRRAKSVAPNYEMINWSPLVPTTQAQVDALKALLGAEAPPMTMGMMFSEPSIRMGVRRLHDVGVNAIIALGFYPHYSFSTMGSAYDMLVDALAAEGHAEIPVHWVPPYYGHPKYIEGMAATIREGAAALGGEGPIQLLFSPHGLPVSYVERGDPYPKHVEQTVEAVVAALEWTDPWHVGWQSRVGPVKWLTPSTPDKLKQLAEAGAQRVLVVPVSFVSEHIETLHELDIELRADSDRLGIPHFGCAPALGMQPAFIECLAELVQSGMARFDQRRCPACDNPRAPEARRQPKCPRCGFATPKWLMH